MTDRPLIGVTTSEVRYAKQVNPTPHGEPPRREMALGLTYLRAIEAAGGLPVVLPPLAPDAIAPLLQRLAGLCLSGGPDIDPDIYGERPHAELGPTEPDLDRFEIALAREADASGLPILAICRGTQALNVARGGTLVQHLPQQTDGSIEHAQTDDGEQATHTVDVVPGTKLATLTGGGRLSVNSFHHQAVDRMGDNLIVAARAPDHVIEAVEDPDREEFLIAVQWHAETLVHRPEQATLFRALVTASANFAGIPLSGESAAA
jgi:putative glutamine amidotransferase